MPTDGTIQDHYMIMFNKNVELLLQQKRPYFMGLTGSAGYVSSPTGQNAQVVLQFGEVEMDDFLPGTAAGNWKGDTVWDDIPHDQRWVFPTDKVLSLPISKQDELRMIINPTSPYAEAMRAAYARTYDDMVIAAATGDAKTGRFDDIQTVALPADQIVADTAGLTIDTLIDVKMMLLAAEIDPSEPLYFAVTSNQLGSLLRQTEVQSTDYNSIKALVNGEVDTFMGFKFVRSERLAVAAGVRTCFAWAKSGLHVGIWDSMKMRSDPRPDKNYVQQLWMSCTLGATRTQEKKVVQVNCTEA